MQLKKITIIFITKAIKIPDHFSRYNNLRFHSPSFETNVHSNFYSQYLQKKHNHLMFTLAKS